MQIGIYPKTMNALQQNFDTYNIQELIDVKDETTGLYTKFKQMGNTII